MEQIFMKGDTVYHWKYGKGIVDEVYKNHTLPIKVMFDDSSMFFTSEGKEHEIYPPTLSHTLYNFIDGGFSQRKPLPNIKKGTPVFIKFPTTKRWVTRIFSHFNSDREICTFNDSYLEGDTTNWKEYSLENPIKYDK